MDNTTPDRAGSAACASEGPDGIRDLAISKRDGRTEPYDGSKIKTAMSRAFAELGAQVDDNQLDQLLQAVESSMIARGVEGVEGIQDLVERALMEQGFYDVAKAYILYRHHRAERRGLRQALAQTAGVPDLVACLERIERDFTDPAYSLEHLEHRFSSFAKPGMSIKQRLDSLIKAAVELTCQEAPRWEMIAGRLLAFRAHRELASTQERLGLVDLYAKLRYLTDQDLYGDYILAAYTREEIDDAARLIDDSRDELFAYAGLDLLLKRYVIRTRDHQLLESPQEMYLGIALHLAMNEKTDRLGWVERFYNMLSRLEVIV